VTAKTFSFAAVILAAGASSRMGRPKMLLPWGESTVLGHLIAQWRSVGATQIAVVCAAGDDLLNQELDRIGFPREQRIVNPEPARGMFSSIQCAARWPAWSSSLTHWVIALGDQPHLSRETLRSIAEFAAQHADNICQTALDGRPRHPVVLPRRMFKQLAESNYSTLREFLNAHATEVCLVEVDDPGVNIDLDTPADYESAVNREKYKSASD
jgi:molybdenum cofactor cytidylyltransferase